MTKDKKATFKGVGTALITPFLNGEIDYGALDRLIEEQILAGVSALIVGGTTGEAATLTQSERYALYEHSVEQIGGRCSIVLGTGTNDTKMAIEHTKFAASVGASAALVVTPYYNKGTEEGVYLHYMRIAETSDIPIILYNVPTRTGVNLGLHLLEKLADHPNISGLKEASDSVDRLVALAQLRDTLPLYAGNDSQIYPVLSLGGVGAISVASNIYPKAVGAIFDAYIRGRTAQALDIQIKLLPLIRALFLETNPAPLKYAMSKLGKSSGELRLPLFDVRESTKAQLDEAIANANNICN